MPFAAESSRADNFASIDVSTTAWVVLAAIVVAMLGIDLYRHRHAHAPSQREALIESAVWVATGIAFGFGLLAVYGGQVFGEYISGYLIEKSLSIDNVFVWSLLFTTMSIPIKYQHRVLFWGIFGALALRGIFIAAGSALIAQFWWVLLIFGVFLIFTGAKIIRHKEDEGEAATVRGMATLEKIMPVTHELDGQKFFTMQNGKRAATPLFAALVVIELTDVIFAVDSVPAILAVSHEPYIVFASNAFAILGLRAMYFLLANAREQFHYLSHGLGAILIFVGIKMTVSHWYHLNTYVSLAVIASLLAAAVVFSLQKAKQLGVAPSVVHEHHDH